MQTIRIAILLLMLAMLSVNVFLIGNSHSRILYAQNDADRRFAGSGEFYLCTYVDYVPPCIGNNGSMVFSCDDPRHLEVEQTCTPNFPSPQSTTGVIGNMSSQFYDNASLGIPTTGNMTGEIVTQNPSTFSNLPTELEKQLNERWGKQQNKQSCIDMNYSVPCTDQDLRLLKAVETQQTDEDIWNSVTNNGRALPDKPVRVLVYIDILAPIANGTAQVCVETKGDQYGDAEDCPPIGFGIAGITSTSTYAPFAFDTKPTSEGVYLPEGRQFFACVKIDTIDGQHKQNCAQAKNTPGNDIIAVHVPFLH